MDDLIKLSILDEVDTQCLLALSSYQTMVELTRNAETRQLKEVWKHLQVFLAHSEILGSLIFKQGNPEKTKVVTDYLKSELRGGRNFLEHIEVFEVYASNRKDAKGIIEMVFESMKGLEYIRQDSFYIKRGIILDEMVFMFQNQGAKKELPLDPIFQEVSRISKEVENARQRLPII